MFTSSLLRHTARPATGNEITIKLAPFHVIKPGSYQHTLILRNSERWHPHFHFDNGDLFLASSAVDFRVHIDTLVHQSSVLTYLFQRFEPKAAEGMIYMPILGEDPDDWACLLGLLYDERGNSLSCPTFRELLGVLRIPEKYGFTRIQAWAMAHLRADFFPNPQHFQEDPEDSEEALDKLTNALEVIAASYHSQFETATLALAFYAVARRNPKAPATVKLVKKMSQPSRTTMLTGYAAIERKFKELEDKLSAVANLPRPTVSGHCSSECFKYLVKWAADAKVVAPDSLKMLRQLWDKTLPEAVCVQCAQAARFAVEDETLAIYRNLPTYFGFEERQDDGWELTDDRKQFLSKDFRL